MWKVWVYPVNHKEVNFNNKKMGYRIIGNFSVVPHSGVDFTALLRSRHYSFFLFLELLSKYFTWYFSTGSRWLYISLLGESTGQKEEEGRNRLRGFCGGGGSGSPAPQTPPVRGLAPLSPSDFSSSSSSFELTWYFLQILKKYDLNFYF